MLRMLGRETTRRPDIRGSCFILFYSERDWGHFFLRDLVASFTSVFPKTENWLQNGCASVMSFLWRRMHEEEMRTSMIGIRQGEFVELAASGDVQTHSQAMPRAMFFKGERAD